MLTIHQSTDADALFEAFASELARSRRSVFERATVIVPSMTVRDYLDNRLADRDGISTLLDARFFGMFAWALVEKVTADPVYPSMPPLSRAAMQWRMFAGFSARLPLDSASPDGIDRFLAGLTRNLADPDAILALLWQTAGEFARIFARYLHMRPDWLALWSRGQGGSLEALFSAVERDSQRDWPAWMREHYQTLAAVQQAVWQQDFADAFLAREARLAAFWETLAQGRTAALPPTLFVYGLETPEADMLAFLERLAPYCDIHVYHHAVSDGYFGDMVDDRWLKRLQLDQPDQHYDPVHPLLSRYGKEQRDIFRLWIAGEEHEQRRLVTLPAAHPPPATLLATLQAEIRELNPSLLADFAVQDDDDSLRIHACHGLMRQLEALRGELARWFAADPARQPADVLVVLPELENAENLLRTVFPPSGDYDGHILPARLTGITPPAAQQLWQSLAGLYTLPATRFEADRVLNWLRDEHTAAMLGIAPATMNHFCEALLAAGYRRGLDDAHDSSADRDARFTFTYALDRLLAGLWLGDIPLHQHTVPQPGADAATLDAVCALVLHWQQARREQTQTRPVRHWLALLREQLANRFAHAANTPAHRTIEQTLHDLDGQLASLEAHTSLPPVTLAFVLQDIGKRLSAEHTGSEPSGVMTIGKIGAMRTLPYKLVAFVGANIADFPANPPDDRHDLSRLGHKRPGDIHPEHQDLAAFLDILRHAKEALWIFYDRYAPGSRDEQLPAQPVQALVSYLEEHCPQARILREHGSDPFQYDAPGNHPPPLWQQVRESLATPREAAQPFIPLAVPEADLAAPLPAGDTLHVSTLRHALLYPATTFMRARELAVHSSLQPDPELEPLRLDNLENYRLDQTLIEHPDDPRLPHLPLLPAGAAGQALHSDSHSRLASRRAALLAASGERELTPVQEQLITLDSLTLAAILPQHLATPRQLILHPGKANIRQRLGLWWQHLIWQSAGGRGETWCAFADGIHVLAPVADAESLLRAWLNVYQHSQQQLWLLPPAIGEHWLNGEPPDDNQLQPILNKWRHPQYPDEDLDAFLFLLRGHEDSDVNACLLHSAQRYAPALYAPIAQYSTQIE
ncbi:MAG: exodeoxyribonuclease V subunit gamma [Cardiobacteriaceae bacterium]|nr:exodeoxyribonuclease V subunit gamma [Cardiobacteriaceae bacterium]